MPRGGPPATRGEPLLVVVLLLAVASAPALAETGTAFDRHIERMFALPTPVGPFLLMSDRAAWRVDVPTSAIVSVEAEGSASAPFIFRVERLDEAGSSLVVPTTHAGYVMSEPGAWRVSVDPVAGVEVDITIRFRSANGASFTLTDLELDRGCLFPAVCLP